MRLISQHGNVDIPYEKAILSHNNNIVRADVGNFDFTMGVYSSGEKAYKVMDMVRSSYVNNECYKSLCSGTVIPLPNNSDDAKEKSSATNMLRRTTFFQFPSDDEVEV